MNTCAYVRPRRRGRLAGIAAVLLVWMVAVRPGHADPGPGSSRSHKDSVLSGPPNVPDKIENIPVRSDDVLRPVETLTLPAAKNLAIEMSPELASFAWEVRARESRAVQAGLRPNPEFEGEMENFAGSGGLRGSQSAEATLMFSQELETAGKRAKRRQAAVLDTEVAGWEYETARRRVLGTVTTAFVGVLAAQRRVALSEELVRVAEATSSAVARLVGAGATPSVERTRSSVEVGIARVELASARREVAAARAELAATWGAETPLFERAEGDLSTVSVPPSLDALRDRMRRNPWMARWDREIARRESVVALEDAQRRPNVTARAGFRRLNDADENAFIASFGMPFPLFDRNQGARAAAQSDLRKGRYERRAAEVEIGAQLVAAYEELVARYGEVTELRQGILPSAQQTFEGIQKGYQQGLFRNLDVLDAQRRLFELRLREIEALRGYHVALAQIEQLADPVGATYR